MYNICPSFQKERKKETPDRHIGNSGVLRNWMFGSTDNQDSGYTTQELSVIRLLVQDRSRS
jgi:hypothetical protein